MPKKIAKAKKVPKVPKTKVIKKGKHTYNSLATKKIIVFSLNALIYKQVLTFFS